MTFEHNIYAPVGCKFTPCKKCKLAYLHCDNCGYVRVAHTNPPEPVIKQLRLV